MSSVLEKQQEPKGPSFLDILSSSSDEDELMLQSLLIKRTKQNNNSQKSPNKRDSEQTNDNMTEYLDNKGSKNMAAKSNTQLFLNKDNQKQTDIIDIIEKNEKMNEACPDKLIEQPSQLLSFDNKFYNVQKKLMVYSDFPQITKKLHFQKDHQYSGIASSIAVRIYL